jgi:peptidoglycan/xylan/chitin deacetylase (PgdA/CDA1 family)
MSRAELCDAAQRGHEIGAHTCTHADLPTLEPHAAKAEIHGSKLDLEDMLGTNISSFAYPKGRYNAAVREMVINSGFDYGVCVDERLLTSADDPFTLPRIGIHGRLSTGAFQAKVSRSLETYLALKRYVRGRRGSVEVEIDE